MYTNGMDGILQS